MYIGCPTLGSNSENTTGSLCCMLSTSLICKTARSVNLSLPINVASYSLPSESERSVPFDNAEPAQKLLEADAAVEVWEAFSTESSARRFAHTAGEGLGVEIDVVERSPNRFVPTVMCRQGADCTSILNAFNAMFSFEQTDA